MMIVRLSAQGSSFSHSRRLRRLAGISQPSRYLRNRTTEKFVLPFSVATPPERYPTDLLLQSPGLKEREVAGAVMLRHDAACFAFTAPTFCLLSCTRSLGLNRETQADSSSVSGSGPKAEIFDVFLCHNSQDKPAIREILRDLAKEDVKAISCKIMQNCMIARRVEIPI